MESIYQIVKPYIDEMKNNEHHRFCEWEHCYSYFGEKHVDEHIACLHLATYLSIFGMYTRGFQLMQHDHLYLMPAVKIMLANKQLREVPITQDDILRIDNELQGCFKEQVTDTLRTKIIMGTLGILPAYDRYVKEGLKAKGFTQKLGSKSIEELFNFAINHAEEINEAQVLIKEERGIEYPMMRVLDMYFWEIGKKEEEKKGDKQ
jgi:hypothetical protein